MLAAGNRACAMEVSSHALELGRISGVRFAAAVFTNMSRDHLDFHATMEDYFQAKRRLFCPPAGEPGPAANIVNVGDPYGRRLAAELERPRTFAVESPAEYSADRLRCGLEGCRFALRTPDGAREVASPLPGRFNVANALGALAAVDALGGELEVLVDALERGVVVPGRMQPVTEGQDFAVLIDYAHTPDSLENVLRSARELTGGRIVCVFGAGGDRDRGKRPLMGAAAARLAHEVIVTSDNPRSEDPQAIIAEIMAGLEGRGNVRVEPDRAAAITLAVELADSGDVVVIAGKGHEQGQELADRTIPFDDATVARQALRAALTRA
jgi:UDP-N-acetylmuramoyl-L-alanyl-D-glutamate--2,6-diaminopimelate ligase